MNLAQKVFDIAPNWLRIRIFELTKEEKFFLEILKEERTKIIEYILSGGTDKSQISGCKYTMRTLNFLLDKYGEDGRFYRYFSEQAVSLGQDFEFLSKDH